MINTWSDVIVDTRWILISFNIDKIVYGKRKQISIGFFANNLTFILIRLNLICPRMIRKPLITDVTTRDDHCDFGVIGLRVRSSLERFTNGRYITSVIEMYYNYT